MSLSKGGFLRYKCRMCGEEYQKCHVPDTFLAMMVMLGSAERPQEWGQMSGLTDFHHHEKQPTTGFADFIGVVEDD